MRPCAPPSLPPSAPCSPLTVRWIARSWVLRCSAIPLHWTGLNAIIFDRLPRELLRRVNESDATMVGIDAINLVESGLYRLCRRTVAVLAPTETRVRRIMARDGISEDYARLRVQAQKPDEFYRAHCTDVLMNDAASPQVFEEIAYQRLQHIFEEEADHE